MSEEPNSLEVPDPNEVLNKFFEIDELKLTRKDRSFIVAQLRAQREVFMAQEAAGLRKRAKVSRPAVTNDPEALMDRLMNLMGVVDED